MDFDLNWILLLDFHNARLPGKIGSVIQLSPTALYGDGLMLHSLYLLVGLQLNTSKIELQI